MTEERKQDELSDEQLDEVVGGAAPGSITVRPGQGVTFDAALNDGNPPPEIVIYKKDGTRHTPGR